MDQEINVKEMEKIVRESGMYEENMSKKDIEDYYKAITNSKDTATTENESREFSMSEINMEELNDSSQNEDTNNEENLSEVDSFGFFDMPKSKEKPLKICYHPVKYQSIQSSKKFLQSNGNVKAAMLYNYHTNLGKQISNLCRQSFFRLPLPKPIVINEISIDSLSLSSDDLKETYVSRSGRLTKRKTYNEHDEDSSDAFSNKKQKHEDEWLSKTKTKSKTASKELDGTSASATTKNSENKVTTSATASSNSRTNTPKSKKLNVAETIQKSNLFSDVIPKAKHQIVFKPTLFEKTSNFPREPSRCEVMFDQIKKDLEKKQKEEKIMELFQESLAGSDDEESVQKEQENEEIISIIDDEPFPRRVIPPRPPLRRKNVSAKNLVSSTEKIVSNKKENANVSIESNRNQENPSKADSTKNGVDFSSKSTIMCPLCGSSFPQDEIMEHASSCGENEVIQKYNPQNQMLCNICEKVVLTNYDVHVNDCIKLHQEMDQKK